MYVSMREEGGRKGLRRKREERMRVREREKGEEEREGERKGDIATSRILYTLYLPFFVSGYHGNHNDQCW